jgi:hypothetical protein
VEHLHRPVCQEGQKGLCSALIKQAVKLAPVSPEIAKDIASARRTSYVTKC